MQFKDVIGQKQLKKHLIQEVNSGKISHAQLFLGKPGYGGLPLALAFVQYLFCDNKGEEDSCGVCPSCRKTEGLQHPDLHFSFPIVLALSKTTNPVMPLWRSQIEEQVYFDINDWISHIDPKERQATIGTDESQEIIRKLSLKSYEGGYKVMMIWMAEEMNLTCSNKLLKILEEPPANTLFILVCASQDTLLPTILSRTQLLKIPRVAFEDVDAYLRKDLGINNTTASSINARCDGDLIEARRIAESHEDQDNNRELFIQLMRVCYKKDVIPMMDWAEKMGQVNRERQKIFIEYALHMFRQSMLRNYTQDQLTRVSEEEDEFLNKFARFITGKNIMDFMQSFDDAYYHLERNANPRILFTHLCFNVMRYIHKA
jgi:DNA polymerase-3 subunit delta'